MTKRQLKARMARISKRLDVEFEKQRKAYALRERIRQRIDYWRTQKSNLSERLGLVEAGQIEMKL